MAHAGDPLRLTRGACLHHLNTLLAGAGLTEIRVAEGPVIVVDFECDPNATAAEEVARLLRDRAFQYYGLNQDAGKIEAAERKRVELGLDAERVHFHHHDSGSAASLQEAFGITHADFVLYRNIDFMRDHTGALDRLLISIPTLLQAGGGKLLCSAVHPSFYAALGKIFNETYPALGLGFEPLPKRPKAMRGLPIRGGLRAVGRPAEPIFADHLSAVVPFHALNEEALGCLSQVAEVCRAAVLDEGDEALRRSLVEAVARQSDGGAASRGAAAAVEEAVVGGTLSFTVGECEEANQFLRRALDLRPGDVIRNQREAVQAVVFMHKYWEQTYDPAYIRKVQQNTVMRRLRCCGLFYKLGCESRNLKVRVAELTGGSFVPLEPPPEPSACASWFSGVFQAVSACCSSRERPENRDELKLD